jgi:6,7-dimethyl-8-ribityllumazine synthase
MKVDRLEPGPPPSKVGVAVSVFNQAVTELLLTEALDELEELGVEEVVVVEVAGALELPVAALGLIRRGCRAVVALGAVIRGETDHYEIVTRESARGLMDVALGSGVPVANGVLACHDYGQAVERSRPGPANRGREAVRAAVEAARLLQAPGR